MKTRRDDTLYLDDMLHETANISEFTRGMSRDSFLSSELVRRAVERSVQIIGEAAKGLSEDFKRDHSEIEWRKIIAMRNLITHAYGDVDYFAVWEVVVRDIPEFERSLQAIKKNG